MPLNVQPGSTDIAVTGWVGITVSIAWALLAEGVRIRPQVLSDARDHVLFNLDPALSLAQAEDRASTLTRSFVARARRRRLKDPFPQDGAMPLSPRWYRALDRSLTSLTATVFRQHYGDERSLEEIEASLQVDQIVLEGVRGGLREIVRRAACADGVPIQGWSHERIDRLLRRLAAFSPGNCPPLRECLDGKHREHVQQCTRCTRTIRLLRAKRLTEQDLAPPTTNPRSTHDCSILALHFHPDARHHRDRLARETSLDQAPIDDDLLLIDWSDPIQARELILLAAEVSAPHRDHIRGAVLEGPGCWSRHGLLGPLAELAGQAVRSRSWGTVDTIGELPAPLPAPPSARRSWFAVASFAMAAAVLLPIAFRPAPPDVDHPIEVAFSRARGGIWIDFDVEDHALVTLVRETSGGLDLVLQSKEIADKIPYAVGDGSFRLHTMGSGVLLVSSDRPLPSLAPMLAAASTAESPLVDLAGRIATATPRADIHIHRYP